MALGSSYDNNRDQQKHTNVYSAYGSINTRSQVDQTKIRYGFWNKLLKIEIVPIANKTDDGKITWDYKSSMAAFLSHTKAYILASEIRKFLQDPEKYNSSGVISNETLVTISNGSEFGTSGYFLVLRKINKETGATMSSYAYEFNTSAYNSVRNYNEKDISFDTEFDEYSQLEITQLLDMLDSYVSAMTYATAYSVVDASDYNYYQMMDTLEAIASNLGVSTGNNGGSKGGSSKSVFNQRNNSSNNGQTNSFSSSMNAPEHVDISSIEGDLFD